MIQKSVTFLNSIKPYVWVIGATALSFAFATYNLGSRSLWYDEAFSVFTVQKDWTTFWTIVVNREGYQPLYLFLLKLWIPLGDDETTLRFLSVLFSAASIPLIYLVGKELFDSRAGIVAAFLLGVNEFFIFFAQEARGYSLLLFLTLCSSHFAIRCVKSPSRKSWALYIMFSVLAVYAHLFGVWVLLFHAASLFFLPRKTIDWKGISYSGVIIAMCILPLAFFIVNNDVAQTAWIPKPTLNKVGSLLKSFTGSPENIVAYIYFFLCVIPTAFLARACIQHGFSLKTWRHAFIVCWFYLPIILVYCVSLVKPMFIIRYLIVALPGFILLAAVTLTRFDRRWISILASTTLVITSASFTINSYATITKANWRGAAELVEFFSADKNALLFFLPGTRIPFEYYISKANKSSKTFYYTNPSMPYSDLQEPNPPALNEEWIKQISKRHKRLWFIVGMSRGHPKLVSLSNWLQKFYIKQHAWDFGNYTFVTLYLNKENQK